MFTFHVDLGQIIIASLIGIVGYLVGHLVKQIDQRLDDHQKIITRLVGDVQYLIGKTDGKRDR
jgi:hypothetical protein